MILVSKFHGNNTQATFLIISFGKIFLHFDEKEHITLGLV